MNCKAFAKATRNDKDYKQPSHYTEAPLIIEEESINNMLSENE